MKRNINLVSYENSDEETEAESLNHAQTSMDNRRKLPRLSPSLTDPLPPDNPLQHQGRVRTTPHLEGQFSAFVYIPVSLKKDMPLYALLGEAVQGAQEIEPALLCDWLDSSSSSRLLHISLTRPIYLRHYQREELKRAVKAAARKACPMNGIASFIASFSNFTVLDNDERTRTFLGVEVGAGHSQLRSLSAAIEPTLKLLHQKTFYSEPRFHASLAWVLLSNSNTPPAGTPTSTPPNPPGNVPTLPRPISSFPPSFLRVMNERFGRSLSNIKTGTFEVQTVNVKVGKEIFAWPLGAG